MFTVLVFILLMQNISTFILCTEKIIRNISNITLLNCGLEFLFNLEFSCIYRRMSSFLFILSFDGFCRGNKSLTSSSETNFVFRHFEHGETVLWLLRKAFGTCILKAVRNKFYIYVNIKLPLLPGFLCDKWFLMYFWQYRALSV